MGRLAATSSPEEARMSVERIRTVGVVGIGRMGSAMAAHLARSGLDTGFVAHRSRERVDDLVRSGCREAVDVATLAAECEALVLSLPSSAEVSGTLGTIAALDGRKPRLLLDTTTALPAETERWAQELSRAGITLCDAPVTGGPPEARAGRLNTLFGGSDDHWTRAEPIVRSYSEQVVRAGPVGAGHRLKLLNNMLTVGYVCLAAEALRAAEEHGVDIVKLRDVATLGAAHTVALESLVAFRGGDDSVLDFTIAAALKDLDYAAATFELDQWSAVVAGARDVLRRAVDDGLGEHTLPWLLARRT
jgi:3-hydroxyisobutyrate dehydrogenase-like beta-hydroxyacid dehydrogenase